MTKDEIKGAGTLHWHAWLHPELPQVNPHRRGYFEGWYYKLVDAGNRVALALIPGVATGPLRCTTRSSSAALISAKPTLPPQGVTSGGHCFVQALCPQLGLQADVHFPLDQYRADRRDLHVAVGTCEFRRDWLRVNLHDGHDISGELHFEDIVPFPARGLLRGPMGPFGWLPGMECYHGIVNVRHRIAGTLRVDGREIDFTDGSGYVEKDWGRSFPSAWVWLQGNHFEHSPGRMGEQPGCMAEQGPEAPTRQPKGATSPACFLFSAAIIPSVTGSFLGFFALLMDHGNARIMATYNGARLRQLHHEGNAVRATVAGRAGTMEVFARSDARGLLRAPKNGLMDRTIEESITAVLDVRWRDTHGNVIFEGRSPHGGMECCQTQELLTRLHQTI